MSTPLPDETMAPPTPAWVVVLDSDEVSQRQLQVCRATRPPELQGAIHCDDPDNASNPLCTELDYFPAFCNVQRNSCVYGLRQTRDDFEQLVALTTTAPPTHTTAPRPSPTP